MASRTRTELTVEEKLHIIQSLRTKTLSRRELQAHYNINNTTINRILSFEDRLRTTTNSKMRRIRQGSNRLVDEAVSKWYRAMREKNAFVNGPLLRQQAVRIARMMNNHTFDANNGWLWRWQKKENVKFNSNYGRPRDALKARLALLCAREDSAHTHTNEYEISEIVSLQSDADGNGNGKQNGNASSQSNSNRDDDNARGSCDIDIKEEMLMDPQENPFEAEVVFGTESDEHEGYDCDNSRNTNSLKYLDGEHEQGRNDYDESSVDPESQYRYQQYNLNDSPKENRINDSFQKEQSSIHKRLGIDIKDSPERDVYSMYADYIAQRLRTCASERDKYEIYVAQHNIDEIMFKLSVGYYARVPEHLANVDNLAGHPRKNNEVIQEHSEESIAKDQEICRPTTSTDTSNPSRDCLTAPAQNIFLVLQNKEVPR